MNHSRGGAKLLQIAGWGAEVGQSSFTKRCQFGYKVVFTDSSWRLAFARVVDATAAP
jgi:hypothetical protein